MENGVKEDDEKDDYDRTMTIRWWNKYDGDDYDDGCGDVCLCLLEILSYVDVTFRRKS